VGTGTSEYTYQWSDGETYGPGDTHLSSTLREKTLGKLNNSGHTRASRLLVCRCRERTIAMRQGGSMTNLWLTSRQQWRKHPLVRGGVVSTSGHQDHNQTRFAHLSERFYGWDYFRHYRTGRGCPVAGCPMVDVVGEANWIIIALLISHSLHVPPPTPNSTYRDVSRPIPCRATGDTDFATGCLYATRFIPPNPQHGQR
jgi:hypothetical protein